MENTEGKEKATTSNSDIWLRGLYMLLFWIVLRLSEFAVAIVMIVQWIYRIYKGKLHPPLLSLGDSLSQYVYQIVSFQTFKTEEKPFPFSSWPAAAPVVTETQEAEVIKEGEVTTSSTEGSKDQAQPQSG